MSMSVLLVPLAVAICVSASETMAAVTEKCKKYAEEEKEQIQTRFNNKELLLQTLEEHGLDVSVFDENSLLVKTIGGVLKYTRNSEDDPFSMELENVENVDCLINDLHELDNEYDRNVQSFTYNKVLQNLPPDMTVVEDTVLEDDTIVLTLQVNNSSNG